MLRSEASVTRVRVREVSAAIGGQPQEGTGERLRSVVLGIRHSGDHSQSSRSPGTPAPSARCALAPLYESDPRGAWPSQRCARRAASRSGGSGPAAAAATFAARCSGRRIPGMTVVTSGLDRMNRRASWASVWPSGTSGRSASTRDGRLQVRLREVAVAPVRLRPAALERHRVGQAPLVERHPGDDRHAELPAGREELVLRRLVEDVVDDLDRVDRDLAAACVVGVDQERFQSWQRFV